MDRIAAAADYLFELRQQKRPVEALPDTLVPRSLEEGYRVQQLLVSKLLDQGQSQPIGYKIACTSELAQKALGVTAPFFGVLMSHSTTRSPSHLPGADFLVRCAEVEFGFAMAQDVPGGVTYTAETIRPYIGALIPSIEIVDHRYHDWKTVGAPSLLADNAIHGAWVEGEPCLDWQSLDLTSYPTLLIVNGQKKFPGSGAAVLGNPLNVVAWLANELPKFGRRLSRGDKITTGLTTDVYLAAPGDHLVGDFGPLGRVELTCDGTGKPSACN
jgi:2-keto-4-pentenoate hydratase